MGYENGCRRNSKAIDRASERGGGQGDTCTSRLMEVQNSALLREPSPLMSMICPVKTNQARCPPGAYESGPRSSATTRFAHIHQGLW